MGATVVSFLRREPRSRDWSTQELAEFYRVHGALVRTGVNVEVDRGLTDEGDPWFVFCRAEDGEVMIHFARIGGMYLVDSPAYGGTMRGANFNALVRELVERHPVVQPRKDGKSNLIFHPSALLVVLVATAIFKASEARAFSTKSSDDTTEGHHSSQSSHEGLPESGTPADSSAIAISLHHAAVILSAVALVLTSDPAPEPAVSSDIPVPVVLADSSHKGDPQNDPFVTPVPHSSSTTEWGIALAGLERSAPDVQPDVQLDSKVALPLVATLWDLPKDTPQAAEGAVYHAEPSMAPLDLSAALLPQSQSSSLDAAPVWDIAINDAQPPSRGAGVNTAPASTAHADPLSPPPNAVTDAGHDALIVQLHSSSDILPNISAVLAFLDPSGTPDSSNSVDTVNLQASLAAVLQTIGTNFIENAAGTFVPGSDSPSPATPVLAAQIETPSDVGLDTATQSSTHSATANAPPQTPASSTSGVQVSQATVQPSVGTHLESGTSGVQASQAVQPSVGTPSDHATSASDQTVQTASVTQPAANVGAIAPSQDATQTVGNNASSLSVQTALGLINEFSHDVTGVQYEVYDNGHAIVVFDPSVLLNANIQPVTFHFTDGSQISIIGSPYEISHLGLLV